MKADIEGLLGVNHVKIVLLLLDLE
jgi:hypothetical protein